MQIVTTHTPINGLFIIETKVFEDERGFFMESYSKRAFSLAGINEEFVQENHSRSQKGVLRGLHFQNMDAPMTKLVRCTQGRVFDVAVDLRASSQTYGQWFGLELSSENKKMLYIPVGFAHGFQTVSETAEVQYKQTNYYEPTTEGSVIWNDLELNIPWPLPNAVLSEKDQAAPSFAEYKQHPIFT